MAGAVGEKPTRKSKTTGWRVWSMAYRNWGPTKVSEMSGLVVGGNREAWGECGVKWSKETRLVQQAR